MSDVVTLARTARQSLAQGLSALQAPGVPTSLGATAEPVARAMGLLHQIENGADDPVDAANNALDAVRAALGSLQAAGENHKAVNQAMEMVANSLGVVHQMTRTSSAPNANTSRPSFSVPRPAGSSPRSASGRPLAASAAPGSASQRPAQPSVQSQAAGSKPVAKPTPQPVSVPQAVNSAAQFEASNAQPATPSLGASSPAVVAAPASPKPAGLAAMVSQPPVKISTAPAPQQAAPSAEAQQQQPVNATTGSKLAAEAALGAHSNTNFYKGLSGNDVIDSGGIFVATYDLPKIGQELRLRVCMPGGYEFEADGIVRWCRDTPKSGSMAPFAPPGYGAQFTEISQEARQLVYRYVRNREPLFHDDL